MRQSAEVSGILLHLPGPSGNSRLEADTGTLMLTRLGLGGADSPVSALPALSFGLVVPLLMALVVLTFAEGVRQSAEPVRAAEGPV